mgnify:CR=1 FL=1
MSKGTATRRSILDHAIALASEVGLGGLTIGSLAEEMDLSKSGLYAHFGSKEALQIQVLDHAALNFTEAVIRPALQEPRGAPRMRALFEILNGRRRRRGVGASGGRCCCAPRSCEGPGGGSSPASSR